MGESLLWTLSLTRSLLLALALSLRVGDKGHDIQLNPSSMTPLSSAAGGAEEVDGLPARNLTCDCLEDGIAAESERAEVPAP